MTWNKMVAGKIWKFKVLQWVMIKRHHKKWRRNFFSVFQHVDKHLEKDSIDIMHRLAFGKN